MPRALEPGYRFKDGKLLIFTEREVLMLRSSPELKALRKKPADPNWTSFIPAFRVLKPRNGAKVAAQPAPGSNLGLPKLESRSIQPDFEREQAFAAFRYSIPDRVVRAVEKLPFRQWKVLDACEKSEWFLGLAETNPALSFCVAYFKQFERTKAPGPVTDLVRHKQRDLAGWLGFPRTECCAKILSRIQPEAIRLEWLKDLRDDLASPEVLAAAANLPSLNAGVLELLSPALRAWTTPKLIQEVAASPEERVHSSAANLIQDIKNMLCAIGRRTEPQPFHSIKRLREIHQEISLEYCRLTTEGLEALQFPEPPLPGTPEIIPLASGRDLIQEGIEQQNCVRTYGNWVASYQGYIYRVLSPERATLAIVHNSEGHWEIQQLLAKQNHGVRPETREFVGKWLERFNVGA
jgi:hypothetical protein